MQHLNSTGGDALAGRGAGRRAPTPPPSTGFYGYARDYGHTFWIVERKADGEVLGFCGLKAG